MKRDYILFLEETEGLDDKSTDKVLAAILKFEDSTGFKPFTKFHIEQAVHFKKALGRQKNSRTGQPLSHATVDATLNLVRKFFIWLAGQSGYRSRLRVSDAAYFKNTRKNARIAHTRRTIAFPSVQACKRAFEGMPGQSETDRRNRAFFALMMLTGARIGALATLRLKHVDLTEKHLYQDAREVETKNAKTIDTWFFPVEGDYLECLTDWVTYLREVKFFGPEDALFPKPKIGVQPGKGFANLGLSRAPYATTGKFNEVIRTAFANVQMPQYTPHSFRKTLAVHGNQVCQTMEQMKAWSLNLGHDNLATTVNSYIPVSRERQRELITELGNLLPH